MKKILILLISSLVVSFCIFAADEATPGSVDAGTDDYGNIIGGAKAKLTASFDMLNSENQKVTIGFIDKETKIDSVGQSITAANSISLNADPLSGTAKYGTENFGYLALFYQIQYDKKVNVKLRLDSDLIYTKEDDTAVNLGWTLTADGKSTSSTSVSGEGASKDDIEITVHDGTKFSSFGVAPLSIVTESYVNLTPGKYIGDVIAEIVVSQ